MDELDFFVCGIAVISVIFVVLFPVMLYYNRIYAGILVIVYFIIFSILELIGFHDLSKELKEIDELFK